MSNNVRLGLIGTLSVTERGLRDRQWGSGGGGVITDDDDDEGDDKGAASWNEGKIAHAEKGEDRCAAATVFSTRPSLC